MGNPRSIGEDQNELQLVISTIRLRSEDNSLVIVVEGLRLAGYFSFLIVIAVGILLTTYFGSVELDQTLLTEVFGYNNICVFFDYPPANYVLPLLWAFTLVILLGYILVHWLRMNAEVQRGTLSRTLYRRLSCLKAFEAFTLICFSTIFAVTPEGWDHTLYIHTAPFFLLQIGMVSLAMSNTLHGIKSGYWRRLQLPSWFSTAAIAYCILFGLVVCFKIPYGVNAMAGRPWWEQTNGLTSIAHAFDIVFFIFAVFVPMAMSGFMIGYKSDRLDFVHIVSNAVRGGGEVDPGTNSR